MLYQIKIKGELDESWSEYFGRIPISSEKDEAGAVITNDQSLTERIRMLRDHGQAQKYYHDIEGYNGRLDSIQCAFLSVKLKHLTEWNEQRRAAAKRYHEMFGDNSGIVLPYVPSYSKPVWHLYVVRVQDREEMQKQLSSAGIGTGIHYPVPLHQQKAYAHLGHKVGDFLVTEKVTPEIVSLPMFPNITAEQQGHVVHEVIRLSQTRKVAAACVSAN